MKLYVTFSRKIIFLTICALLLAVCFASRFSEVNAMERNGETNQNRVDYLNSIGCEINKDDYSRKDIVIPYDFSLVYENYNKVQKEAGYDLSLYKGEKCCVYSFDVIRFKDFNTESNAKANLIVYNGRIIGGDVSSSALDGKMYPLKK